MRLFVSLVFAVLPVFALGQSGPPPVTVAHPVVKEIVEDDEFVGRFEASAQVELRARVSGFLDEVHFQDGSRVEKGQLLFTIDQRQFRTALRQARAQLNVAEASFDFAQEQLQRAEALVGNGTIPQSLLDQRRETFLGAQGALEQARAAIELAELDLEYSEIRAPMSGRIDRALIDPGNLVTANSTQLTTIVATEPIHFYFDIDERFFLAYSRDARTRGSVLQEGASGLVVQVSVADRRVPPQSGYLDFSENRIDAASGTMRVRAVLDNPNEVLAPGLFGRINVPGSLPYEGILIPDAAILSDQNRRLVMAVDADGNVTPIPIRPGPRIDGYRVVREGLDGSEVIVIEGLMRARPGSVVTPEMVDLPPVAAN